LVSFFRFLNLEVTL